MKIEVITPLDLEDFVKRIESLEEDSKLHDAFENIDQIKKCLKESENWVKHLESDREPYLKNNVLE